MPRYIINNEPAPIDFQTTDILQRTLQNAKNLLMCRMGEVPYDRFRGFDPGLFDLPVGEFYSELMPELDRIMIWDPDVNVVSATFTQKEDGGTYIEVTIDIPIGDRI